MTIDIHKTIGKLPIIPKRGFILPNMYYCGPYNPLNRQLIYDKNGNILRYIQKPTGKTYAICAQHDVDYTLSRNLQDKHIADEKMINPIKKLPYNIPYRYIKTCSKAQKMVFVHAHFYLGEIKRFRLERCW